MLSQNGWPASRDPSSIRVVPFTVAGVSFPNGVRSGDVETVLRYVAERFHSTVEPLHVGHCWGYFYKPIEGSSTLSNHASGTAIDINAPAHHMGVRGTFTAAKRAAIRAILTYLNGVVRWGGDYVGRADEMHFEITGDATAVAKVATKIRLATEVKEMDTALKAALDELLSRSRYQDGRVEAIVKGYEHVRDAAGFKSAGEDVWIVQHVKSIENRLTAIEAKLNTL